MATATLTWSLNPDWVTAGSIPSDTSLRSSIVNASIGDITQDHMAASASVISIAPAGPANPFVGWFWFDTSTTRPKFYNGTEYEDVSETVSATAPSSAYDGKRWYDTTLAISRRYSTKNGLTGWHPVDHGYSLMVNKSGGNLALGAVATRSAAPTAQRQFSSTTALKDQSVIGVLMEDIDNNASGVVALVGSGAEVDVLCDNSDTLGAPAAGDALVSYSVAGEASTAGPLAADPRFSATVRITGEPIGAFAECVGTRDATTNLVKARLLSSIGTGQTVRQTTKTLMTLSNWTEGAWQEVDLESAPGNGNQTVIVNPKHATVSEVICFAEYRAGADSNSTDVKLELGPDRTNPYHELHIEGQDYGASAQLGSSTGEFHVATASGDTDSYQDLGKYLQVKMTEDTGTWVVLTLQIAGYVH